MKLVKIIPHSQRASNRVNEHGNEMEIMVDNGDNIVVRSLNETWTYRPGVKGKWVGSLTKEEASWEEV